MFFYLTVALGAVVLLPGDAVEMEDAVAVDAVGCRSTVSMTAATFRRFLLLAECLDLLQLSRHSLNHPIPIRI